jgi:hypothetical protein
MSLANAYRTIRPSVVAIASRFSPQPHFPPIIGTGVVIRSDGLILTNDHVADIIFGLPRRPGSPASEFPAYVMFFENIPGKGMAAIPIEIIGVGKLKSGQAPHLYYGTEPDLALIHIATLKNIPTANIAASDLPVGSDVGILGFPMGTDTLAAPGWLHQIGPTLQRGIISAQLPFECDAPHNVMIDAVVEGGSSGSPIFDSNNGEIVGLLYAGLNNFNALSDNKNSQSILRYSVPTSHTLAISNFIIRQAVNGIGAEFDEEPLSGRKDFYEYLATSNANVETPRQPTSMLRAADDDT